MNTAQKFQLKTTWSAEPSGLLPGGLADIISRQHLQVLDALVSDGDVLFLNSDGENHSLEFTKVKSVASRAVYRLVDGHGNHLLVSSELGNDDYRALAKVADIFTRIPVAFRSQLRELNLTEGSPAQSYYSELSRKLRIQGGLKAITETVFNSSLSF